MTSIELGGNFCLSDRQIERLNIETDSRYSNNFLCWNDVLYTHGGRSAIRAAVNHLGLSGKEVLIPNFTCYSIIDAFLACDCKCSFYKLNRNLTVDIPDLIKLLSERRPSILFTCSLFGFDTLAEMRPKYKEIQAMGVKIIEDVTHSVFGIKNDKRADVIVCSLRKWLEIPDGGFVWGLKDFNSDKFYQESNEPIDIVNNFVKASKYKLKYLQNGDEELKSFFLPMFYKNNDLFDDCSRINRMSNFSHDVLMHADLATISEQRRKNYLYLLENIKNPIVEFIFDELPNYVVPLYCPVYIKDGKRGELQKYLIDSKLYCPIIWPTPEQVLGAYKKDTIVFQKDILSLVIDQRYDVTDIMRLADKINNFK